MKTDEYFKHARGLGAFTAEECLYLARQASELDCLAEAKRTPPPTVVWYEVNPDGTRAKFSQGLTVY